MAATSIVFLIACIAFAQAGILVPAAYVAQPQWTQPQATLIKKVAPASSYQFQYNINDASTGDYHSQSEQSDDGVVRGSYQLSDADGYLRTVDYTADDINGFQASVRREPLNLVGSIIAQPAITKVIQSPWY